MNRNIAKNYQFIRKDKAIKMYSRFEENQLSSITCYLSLFVNAH